MCMLLQNNNHNRQTGKQTEIYFIDIQICHTYTYIYIYIHIYIYIYIFICQRNKIIYMYQYIYKMHRLTSPRKAVAQPKHAICTSVS